MAYKATCGCGTSTTHPTDRDAQAWGVAHLQTHNRDALRAWLAALPTDDVMPSEAKRIRDFMRREFGVIGK